MTLEKNWFRERVERRMELLGVRDVDIYSRIGWSKQKWHGMKTSASPSFRTTTRMALVLALDVSVLMPRYNGDMEQSPIPFGGSHYLDLLGERTEELGLVGHLMATPWAVFAQQQNLMLGISPRAKIADEVKS